MMDWLIPAKTFLLGEYAAIAGGSALVVTTNPCFKLTQSSEPGLQGIHALSPAGRWWADHGEQEIGLQWHDPYKGRGGVGASSAQFLGVYLATMFEQKKTPTQQAMLDAYLNYAWQGEGLRPSGYDVLAQSMRGCSYINRKQGRCESYEWPFPDLAFSLFHTGKKLATHEHLQATSLPDSVDKLIAIVESAKAAFELADSERLVTAVNAYHQQLLHLNLVAEHTRQYIELIKQQTDILAIKGCGAMGADVLLLLTAKDKLVSVNHHLSKNGLELLATSEDLHLKSALLKIMQPFTTHLETR